MSVSDPQAERALEVAKAAGWHLRGTRAPYLLGIFVEDVRMASRAEASWIPPKRIQELWKSATTGGDDFGRIDDRDFGAPNTPPTLADLTALISLLDELGYGYNKELL